MALVKLHGNDCHTVGSLPAIGTKLPDFVLTSGDLSDKKLSDYTGERLVLNIFPSVDTGTCAAPVRRFNSEAGKLANTAVLCVSRDLPFAQARFCSAENLKNVEPLSSMRNCSFGKDYGVTFSDGPLAGLFSRSVVVSDENGKVLYIQQVEETTDEPDYDAALAALK